MTWRSRGDGLTRRVANHWRTRSARQDKGVGPGAEHGVDLHLRGQSIMKINILSAVLLPFAWIAASGHSSPTTDPTHDLQALRASLAPYSSFALAKKAGYDTAITDCMSNGDVGAMGTHWAKTSLINATVTPTEPEALIYEPGANGEVSL